MAKIYLGTIDTTDTGGALVLPPGLETADPDTIKRVIAEAELAKYEATKAELEALHSIFLDKVAIEKMKNRWPPYRPDRPDFWTLARPRPH